MLHQLIGFVFWRARKTENLTGRTSSKGGTAPSLIMGDPCADKPRTLCGESPATRSTAGGTIEVKALEHPQLSSLPLTWHVECVEGKLRWTSWFC